MTNIGSPLTVNTQSCSTTSRRPVRTLRESLTTSSTDISTSTSVRSWSPSDHGHHSRGSLMSRFQSTSLRPPASDCSCWSSSCPSTRVDTRTARAASLSKRACNRRWARVSLTSRHKTRHRSIRTGPVVSMRTGRQRPPGFQLGSIASQFWNTPVMVRFVFRLRCGGQATSTARTCSVDRRDKPVISKLCGKKYPSGSPR